ncbi:MAG: response regulator transcription factor [Bacteroidetes bacterium]|nr:response regulator transcription factor [Bacteroidota bacterium]
MIIDDEPFARRGLEMLLELQEGFTLIPNDSFGEEALKVIADTKPDVLLLDIQMPGLTGFDLLEAIDPRHRPLVVFITAFDQFAVDAFKANAIHYILKPVRTEDFAGVIERIRERMAIQPAQEAKTDIFQNPGYPETRPARLLIKEKGREIFISFEEIKYIEARSYYLVIHTNQKQFLLRDTLANIEQKLDPHMFFRIHRSTVLRKDTIRSISIISGSKFQVSTVDGREFSLSRDRKKELSDWLRK